MIVPYLSFLRCKRIYSEFIFEQVQVYTTNTIMEFATTQSFVKSLEGVRASGILEDPIARDVDRMIELAYQNGSIDESLEYMNNLYPYYIVKNMHQLFLQITKEGAQNYMDSLDNMQLDIDMLVESVYRDRMERATFHKSFLQFGIMLYVMVMLVQYLLGKESYIELLNTWYVTFLLHAILILNSWFLLKGEKYYNENVGANTIDKEKFITDMEPFTSKLIEDDYEFLVYAKYGEDVDIKILARKRMNIALVTFAVAFVMFNTSGTASFDFGKVLLNTVFSIVIAIVLYKSQYLSLKKYYKAHLHEIDVMLPYYLKSLEILIQHYTVPVALAKSIDDAPDIFKPGLRQIVDKINAGDASIDPYMDFANLYPVRDSMRMMRLLYRLGLGSQEKKQERLMMFSRTVSNLQNKARETKYKERLNHMENQTMIMLVSTGLGVMMIILISMLSMFQM